MSRVLDQGFIYGDPKLIEREDGTVVHPSPSREHLILNDLARKEAQFEQRLNAKRSRVRSRAIAYIMDRRAAATPSA